MLAIGTLSQNQLPAALWTLSLNHGCTLKNGAILTFAIFQGQSNKPHKRRNRGNVIRVCTANELRGKSFSAFGATVLSASVACKLFGELHLKSPLHFIE
jgi:hypothetical protein